MFMIICNLSQVFETSLLVFQSFPVATNIFTISFLRLSRYLFAHVYEIVAKNQIRSSRYLPNNELESFCYIEKSYKLR